MAHEIRGPLLAAQAAISRGLSLMEGSPETRTLLVRTLDELRALADRVDHLLAWGAGLVGMEMRVTDLNELAHQVAGSCGAGGLERLRVSTSRDVRVLADPRLLHTAISNIVRNALAYSPAESPVVVSVTEAHGEGVVSILDRGPGLHVNGAGHRSATRHTGGGAGIGLGIARSVVGALGGTVSYLHYAGTTVFRIRLPLVTPEAIPSASLS